MCVIHILLLLQKQLQTMLCSERYCEENRTILAATRINGLIINIKSVKYAPSAQE